MAGLNQAGEQTHLVAVMIWSFGSDHNHQNNHSSVHTTASFLISSGQSLGQGLGVRDQGSGIPQCQIGFDLSGFEINL